MNEYNREKEKKWIKFAQSIDTDITPQAVRIMGKWRRISHALHQVGTASLADSGLSEAQYLVLMSLYMSEQIDGRTELNPSEISKWRGTTRNTISSLIRGLEKEGFVERHLDQQDRRKFNICLTATGRRKVSKHAQQQFSTVGSCFNKLSTAEQNTLDNLLIKLNDNLNEVRAEIEKTAPTTGNNIRRDIAANE